MAFEGRSECAVRECKGICSKRANLCEEHLVPGMVFTVGNSTGVVTTWYAEHGNEAGIILMNDYALGVHFGGASGFEAELKRQGFANVQNLRTPEEFAAARIRASKALGNWSGPWLTKYPWEKSGTGSTQ